MFADPFDASLAALIADVAKTACPDVKFHTKKTLVCMEGSFKIPIYTMIFF